MSRWGLLSNHALVLIHIAEHPRSTMRQIADAVGVTDRAALSLLRAMEEDSVISRRRDGRRNVYTVDIDALLSHRSYGRFTIAQVAAMLLVLSGRDAGSELPDGIDAMLAGLAPATATPTVVPG